MMSTIPITVIGSVAVLLIILAGTSWFSMPAEVVGLLFTVNNLTLGMLAFFVAFFIAKSLYELFEEKEDGSKAGVLSVICFLILTPLTNVDGANLISFEWLGAQGIFTAMITGLVSSRIMVLFFQKNWGIQLPETVPPMIRDSFNSLIPGLVLVVLFASLSYLFTLTSFQNVHNAVFTLVQEPLKGIGGNIGAIIVVATIAQVLWFFGIHGSAITNPVITPILMAMDVENLNAAAQNLPLPNSVGYAFFITYTVCATAIGLSVLMLFAKSERYKALGKLTFPTAIFGISEPLVFGTPLVLNFKLAVPFIFNNAIVLAIAYFMTKIGVVPPLLGVAPIFGLPIGFHAMIQGSWKIVVMQIVTQLIGMAVWYPFFKSLDKEEFENEQMLATEVSHES